MTLVQLLAKRKGLHDEQSTVLKTLRAEDRTFKTDEKESWEKRDKEIVDLTERVDAERRCDDLDKTMDAPLPEVRHKSNGETPRVWGHDTATGAPVYEIRSNQRIGDAVQARPGLSVGRALRAAWSGNAKHRAEAEHEIRLLQSGSSGGSFVVPTELAATILDQARSLTRAIEAGAITIPMASEELTIARLETDVAGIWRQSGAPLTASTPTIGAVRLISKTLATKIEVAVELIEDSPNIGRAIDEWLAARFARDIDAAALNGGGGGNAAEPTGLSNHASVVQTASVGTPGGFSDLVTAYTAVAQGNFRPTALLMNPRDVATYANLTGAGDGQPLQPPGLLAGLYPPLDTTAIPATLGAGSNESFVIIGDFSQLAIGMRTALTVEMFRGGTDANINNLTVTIRAYLRADIAILRPAAFHILAGVTST